VKSLSQWQYSGAGSTKEKKKFRYFGSPSDWTDLMDGMDRQQTGGEFDWWTDALLPPSHTISNKMISAYFFLSFLPTDSCAISDIETKNLFMFVPCSCYFLKSIHCYAICNFLDWLGRGIVCIIGCFIFSFDREETLQFKIKVAKLPNSSWSHFHPGFSGFLYAVVTLRESPFGGSFIFGRENLHAVWAAAVGTTVPHGCAIFLFWINEMSRRDRPNRIV
jgi:hypothetical protein